MNCRSSIGAVAVWAALLASTGAQAFDDSKYPNLKGQWTAVGRTTRWTTPENPAPLTAEYQAIYDANLADQKIGGIGNWPSAYCIAQGMPAMMNLYAPMELIVTPETTYILISHISDSYRRIYTDGRAWPKEIEPSYAGYSIGKWVDTDNDGKYDTLEVETRAFRGPRAFESTGLPMHKDNQTIIKEKFFLDKKNPNLLSDEITVEDHALTRPWTLTKQAKRDASAQPEWKSETCTDDNSLLRIGKETYFLSSDGVLMPMKKNQPAPDLHYFTKTGN